MSLKALPLLYLNLGGEMMYIIEQRLDAQSISHNKAEKVKNDILRAMFDEPFVRSMFDLQQLKDREYMNQLFHRIVHSSIMKLNEQSMTKLLELMTMVFKYQLVFCRKASDLYDITLNHVDSLLEMAKPDEIKESIEIAKRKFVADYAKLNEAQFQFIRQTLLTYLLDIKTRVSVFLQDKTQEMDGNFVLNNGEIRCYASIPGKIVHYDDDGQVSSEYKFDAKGVFRCDNQRTTLGLNIYGKEDETSKESDSLARNETDAQENDDLQQMSSSSYKSSKRELELLSTLLGKSSTSSKVDFSLWIDMSEDVCEREHQSSLFEASEIKASRDRSKFDAISEEFSAYEKEDSQADNLLELMDSNV